MTAYVVFQGEVTDAELYEAEKQAEAVKVAADAEAYSIKIKADADAEQTRVCLLYTSDAADE